LSEIQSRYEHLELSTIGYLVIAVTIGIAAGRIAVVTSREGDTPFLSANDRSRWCTVASLVEDGTYAIDRQIAITDRTGKRRPWGTIDRVRHTGSDGIMHDYSSKPPLFSTIVAGVYWSVRQVSQMSLTDQPIYVGRIVLGIVNIPMLLVMLIAIWRILLESHAPDSAKLYGLAVACFGTALLPMTITLNNHLPAAMTTAVTLMIYLSVAGRTQLRSVATSYFFAGLAAAGTVANELPALAMLVVWTLLFLRQHLLGTLLVFLPAVALVVLPYMITNQMAHQSIRPPYMHRSDGKMIALVETDQHGDVPSIDQVANALTTSDRNSKPKEREFLLIKTSSPRRWIVESRDGNIRYALLQATDRPDQPADSASKAIRIWEVREWDHWYDYAGSYWMGERPGVDAGQSSRLVYTFHLLAGYYGLLSLTPVWVLVPIGLLIRIVEPQGRYRVFLAMGIAFATVVCLAFYISRPEIDRNYGGVSSSFRWMLWFTPLWIWGALPAITWAMETKWTKTIAVVLLFFSVFSMATALSNPWQHPWIYRYFDFLGWIEA